MHEVVIYVGTRKLVALEASFEEDQPRIHHYVCEINPAGFDRGLVVHLEKACASLHSIMDKLMSLSSKIEPEVSVVLGNSKLNTYSFSSSQYYQGMPRAIGVHEIRAVIEQTRSVATLPLSEYVLQAIPESFLVDDTLGIRNPIGLEAHRLGVDLKIFTMAFQDFKNLAKCFEASELEVKGYFPKMLTGSEICLTEQERDEGSLLIDVADDTTQLVLWKNGSLVGTQCLKLGGRFLTSRIAETYSIDFHDAEKLKEQFGALDSDFDFGEEIIPLVERGQKSYRQIRRSEFQKLFFQISKDWMGEILDTADSFARDHKILYPHYIFTGGGTQRDGFIEFLQKVFERDARIGYARNIQAPHELLVDPSLTSAMGMFLWLASNEGDYRRLLAPRNFIEKTFQSARHWFAAYF